MSQEVNQPHGYQPQILEKKWQQYWEEHKTFATEESSSKPKFYALDMFPYPSGAGLHVGHPEGYTATDIISRFKRMKGYNVLHPMGWDAFGLPAEQHALDTGEHPRDITVKNINNFRRQIKSLGFSYDWTGRSARPIPTITNGPSGSSSSSTSADSRMKRRFR